MLQALRKVGGKIVVVTTLIDCPALAADLEDKRAAIQVVVVWHPVGSFKANPRFFAFGYSDAINCERMSAGNHSVEGTHNAGLSREHVHAAACATGLVIRVLRRSIIC